MLKKLIYTSLLYQHKIRHKTSQEIGREAKHFASSLQMFSVIKMFDYNSSSAVNWICLDPLQLALTVTLQYSFCLCKTMVHVKSIHWIY